MMKFVVAGLGAIVLAGAVQVARRGSSSASTLEQAIASCNVDATRKLLEGGADPNARNPQGQPVASWLASGSSCNDADALAIARMLDAHGATFETPRLLSNLAHRQLPKTLAFLATKHGTGDPTEALHGIARSKDLDSIRALLDAGADPTDGVAKSSALLDATMEGHADVVVEMLKHVTDKQSPKVLAAYEFAAKKKDAAVVHAFEAAGVKPLATPAATPSCVASELGVGDRILLSKLGLPNGSKLAGLAGPTECKRIQECGDLVLIDCNSAADGPAYYLDRKTETLLATCGGACMTGCTSCPPKQWTCSCTR